MAKATKKNLYLDRPSMHVDDYDVPVVDQISNWMKDMKLIREYVRSILLTEAMKRPMDLPEHIGVKIRFYGNSSAVINYCRVPAEPGGRAETFPEEGWKDPESGIYGEITLNKINIYGSDPTDCDGAWVIAGTEAADGYGPLLYDIAVEIASKKGSGLVADRRVVSRAAQNVWQHYLDNRSDVDVFQCDDPKNSLTPDDADNLNQTFVKAISAKRGQNWVDSPLSKRFSKKNTMIRELDSLGKLILVNK